MANNNRLLLVVYILGASTVTIFQRYLTFHFDSLALNFYRFLSGSAALFLIAHILSRSELKKLLRNPRQMSAIGIMSFLLVFAQYFTVEGLACTSAVLAGLISTLGIPLTLAVTALFYRDERRVFGSWTFRLGLLLAVGGALCMPLLKNNLSGVAARGVWYLIFSMVIVALVTVWIKKMLQDIPPLSLAAVNCGFTCVFFLPAALLWGDLARIAHVPAVPTLVLFFSGAFGLVMGGWLAMVCIQKAGVITTRLAELAMPVIIGLLGYWLFRETLTIPELVAGVVVMAGCGLVLMRNNTGIPGPDDIPPMKSL